MAGQVTVNATLTYQNPAAGLQPQQLPATKTVTIAGVNYVYESFSVPTTAGGVAIPLSPLSTLGQMMIVNNDTTNYMSILTAVSGTSIIRIPPGQSAGPFQLDPALTAPAWIAHTAAVLATILCIEL